MARPRDWGEAASRLGFAYQPGGVLRQYRLSGTLLGLAAEVVNSDQEYGDSTDYTVCFPALGLGLSLRPAPPLRRLSRRLRGGTSGEVTGNPEFDRAVIAESADPTRLALFLDAGRQAAVLRLLAEYPGARISDDRIRWSSYRLDRAEQVEARVRALAEAALRLIR